MSFAGLILHNVGVKKLRLTLTSLAVAIGVVTVIALGVVTHSLRSSALAIVQTGRADFTVAQKSVYDILNSNIGESTIPRITAIPGVDRVTGVLIDTVRLNAQNPQFLQIGIRPDQLAAFGVTVVAGEPFAADAPDQVMLGWRAAENLNARVGDSIVVGPNSYRIVGIYSTGQAFGDAGMMLPLIPFQATERQPGQVTLLFVRAAPGTDVAKLKERVNAENPQLVSISTATEFGSADRSLSLINAANRGSIVLAVIIGAIVVMCAMSMSFIERTREFGVLSAIGWSRWRIMTMIMSEALVIGVIGAAGGTGLSYLAVDAVGRLPSLEGVLDPEFTAGVFARALLTAAAMSLIGGAYPAIRAALIAPAEALRRE